MDFIRNIKKLMTGGQVLTAAAALLMTAGVCLAPAWAKLVCQIMPTLSITEEFSSNYLKTHDNQQEEFITSYAAKISFALLDVDKKVYLSYAPTYRDYKNLNNRDRLEHRVSLEGEFNPTRHTMIEAQLAYEGSGDDYQGDSRTNTASLSGTTRTGKHTVLTWGHTYRNTFDEQPRTGIYKEHETHTTQAGISHQYGKKNSVLAAVTYESDQYKIDDPDDYKELAPSVTASYWFTPKNGVEANFAYSDKDFKDPADDEKTYSGHLRYIWQRSETLDYFVKYRHSYTDARDYTHHVYHPSVGVDWDVTEDSGISLGLGARFSQWSNENDDSVDPFVDLDLFKRFEFSPRTRLVLTGSSTYSNSGTAAASLGYTTSYRAGAVFDHQLFKRFSTTFYGSYEMDEFHETAVDRKDELLTLGAGCAWTPMEWLSISLNYAFTDYGTNDNTRGDYQDNRVFFSVSLMPEKPIEPERMVSRDRFDDRLFGPGTYQIP